MSRIPPFPLKPLRRAATITLGKMLKSKGDDGDISMPYLRAAHVQPGGLHLHDVKEMWFSPDEAAQLSLLSGDVVVVEGGAGYGRSAYIPSTLDGWGFQNSINRVRPRAGFNGRFLDFAIKSAMSSGQLDNLVNQATIPHLTAEKLAVLPVPHASLAEQQSISDYLDHETAEIDRFIGDHERLSTLLAERRDAALARSVVNASSGSTLREVPWSPGLRTPYHVVNIRRAAAMRTGHTPNRSKAEYWEGDLDTPWFTLADVWQLRAGQKYLGGTKESIGELGLANSAAELLPAGTVVLSRTASVGFTGIMPQPMTTSQDFWNWVCSDHLLPEYLWLQFRAMRPFFDRIKSGSTHKTIYQADAAGMDIVLPPVEAQRAIINELSSTDATTEALIADCTRAIALAKERRAALITAAVTGQIDVTAKHRPAAEQLEDDIKELT